jgi:uncharacterized damage-inducible protein DinB
MNQADLAPQIDYLYWLRDRILAQVTRLEPDAWTVSDTVTSRDLRATLVHELDVELSWRDRLQGAMPDDWRDVALAPEDYPTLEALADRWQADEAEMRAWLAPLGEDDLAAPVTINGTWGFPLWIHLLHPRRPSLAEDQSRGRRVRSSFDGRGSCPGRGGLGCVPGGMFSRGGVGGRLRAASTAATKAFERSDGRLASQADSISLTRMVSAFRRSFSHFECLVTSSSRSGAVGLAEGK